MRTIIQAVVLFAALLLGSGCITYQKFVQSVPYRVEGDGWQHSIKWLFLSHARHVTGHGLDLIIEVENEDRVQELWHPVPGFHTQDPFTVSIYVNSIEDGFFIDWRRLKVVTKGKDFSEKELRLRGLPVVTKDNDFSVKEVRGPYAVRLDQCNSGYYKFEDPTLVKKRLRDDLKKDYCFLAEFNAVNSEVPWMFKLELDGIKRNNEAIPGFTIWTRPR